MFLYLFENWKRLRAPGRPAFLRSIFLGSRRRCPAFFRVVRSSLSIFSRALDKPWRIAPACPVPPPPFTLTVISSCPFFSTVTNGPMTALRCCSVEQYSSYSRLLITNFPVPGLIRTLAVLVLRRPVAINSSVFLLMIKS